MKKLLDLRFVIGFFFGIVGILLTGYYLASKKQSANEIVNIRCGVAFIVFGIVMISFSHFKKICEEPTN